MSQFGVSKTNLKERSSIYKTKSRGISDRLVRGIRVQEERKQSRMGKIDERRRMSLSPLQTENQSTSVQRKNGKEGINAKDDKLVRRREKLQKWREEKLLRKKAEELAKSKKKAFVVKHVSHPVHPDSILSNLPTQKKSANPSKGTGTESTSRITTRSSARLAVKATKEQAGKNSKSGGHTIETNIHKNENKRITRSVASKAKKTEPAPQRVMKSCTTIRTRSKSKHESKSEPTEEMRLKEVEPKLNETNSKVSFQRGSELSHSDDEPTKTHQETPNFSSLVPSEFSFKAPTGVDSFSSLSKSFAFEPLSPCSAQKFMFPSFSSVFDDAPVTMAMVEAERAVRDEESENKLMEVKKSVEIENGKDEKNKVLQETEVMKECKLKEMMVGNSLSPKRDQSSSSNAVCEGGVCGEDEETESTIDTTEASSSKKIFKLAEDVGLAAKGEIGSSHFRNLVETETKRLNGLCAFWEVESKGQDPLPEEVQGMIRTVIGQVQLLVTKKFKQFKGLIDLSEDPDAERKTLSSDLQGFWDMIYFQVEDIDKKFRKLNHLKLNNWEEERAEVEKVAKKKTVKKGAKKPSKTGAKAAEARNKFREMRAQMKAKFREENSCQEAFKLVLTPIKNKKSRIDKREPEVALTPLRRSTRKSLSHLAAGLSTPNAEDHQGFQLRRTPTTDEEKRSVEPITNDLGVDGAREELGKCEHLEVKLKDVSNEVPKEGAGAQPETERSDIPIEETSAQTSSENDDQSQASGNGRQVHTSGNSPTGSCTPGVFHSENDSKGCGAKSTSDGLCDSSKNVKTLSTNGSTRKRRRLTKTRVTFTCSPSPDDKMVTSSKRLYRSTSSRCRVSTPFSNGVLRTTDDEAGLTPDIVTNGGKLVKPETENSSESERTGDEQKKISRRRSSGRKMKKRRSSLKKRNESDIETPIRNLAAEVEKEGNEQNSSFDALYLQPSSDSSNEQVDKLKTPNISLYSPVGVSQSELVTPTPSKLTKTPMPDSLVTPTSSEKALALSEKSSETTSQCKNSGTDAQSLTPRTLLANFLLNESHDESGLINDSVFFPRDKPCEQSSAKENVSPTANLIFFSPSTPSNRACQKEGNCGSVRKFALVTPTKKLESYLGTDAVFSQVRRSARIETGTSKTPKRPAFVSLSQVSDDTDYGYVPNKALI